MKTTHLVPFAALAVLLATGCGKKSSETADKLAALERRANEAVQHQQELEQQLEDQKLAAERDAIERERMQIEDARAELEQKQGEADAAEAGKLRQREIDLAAREGKVEMLQSTLEDKEDTLQQRDQQLSERDRDLAGREALIADNDDNNDDTQAAVGDYGTFYDSLSPYGSWFETPDYGYVWQPVIVHDVAWRPYTRGRWACTDRGWTWLSDEPFGWATYHYGRWALCRGYGWIWVPGCEWAPSWVSWRSSGSHIGWAPLPPESLAFRSHRWDSSVDTTFGLSGLWYVFVETVNFGRPIHNHCLPYGQNNIYLQQTVNITNIYTHNRHIISGGPVYGDICKQTDRHPPYYRLEEDRHTRPGRDPITMRPLVQGDRLRVAAPNMDAAWNDGLKPGRIKSRLDAVKVERQEELKPEVADRFRQSREEDRRKADQSIAELGGSDQFGKRRLEQLDQNRREAEQSARRNDGNRDNGMKTLPAKVADNPNPSGRTDGGPRIFPPKDADKQGREDAVAALRKQQEQLAEMKRQQQQQQQQQQPQTGRTDGGPRIFPPKDADKQGREDAVAALRKQQEQLAELKRQQQQQQQQQPQTGRTDGGPRIFPPKDADKQGREDAVAALRKQQEQLAEMKRQQQQQQPQTGRTDGGPRIFPPKDADKQGREDAVAALRKQQEQLAELKRQQQQQQQQTAQQARQQQQEDARREQTRQQQQAAQQARQQQQEDARREQARQQQQEAQQARQQQMEENRREQARQQQQEAQQARQQQMEENRREQARQQQQEQAQRQREESRQQQETQRQQESARQQKQQQDDDEKKRQRNR